MSLDSVPKDLRQLRACLVCSMVKISRGRGVTPWRKRNQEGRVAHIGVLLNLRVILWIQEDFKRCKTFDQFEFDGCDNCDDFLRMKNNRDRVYDCTSSNFDGMVALMSPEDSWAAKWQRINRFSKGIYAISVAGRLPPFVIREMKSRGINYRPRDVSQR